ncbi:hypothetical protein MnTg02_02762 [bacterium MnTg02]|nr:hypothetical protein MnTg02_02762 [bacterium MnTg02]
MTEWILAVVLGTAFGFALNRVGATNPENIINMLRLTDLHLMKVILFAIGFASLLLFAGMGLGWLDPGNLSIKASHFGVIIGGLLLGAGFAIAGYCPGTGLAAAATGRIDGIVFVIGGLVGAFAYTVSHEAIEGTGLLGNLFGGKATIAVTGNEKFTGLLSQYPGEMVAGALAIALILIAVILPKAFRKDGGEAGAKNVVDEDGPVPIKS